MQADYAILGAGSLGSILAALLAKAGNNVVVLARGRRAEQVAEEGLCLAGTVSATVPVRVIVNPLELTAARILIVATKAIDTSEALHPLRQAKIGVAFSVQNGVAKNVLLQHAVGAGNVLGAVANFSGELSSTGIVQFTRNNGLQLGELDGSSGSRASQLAKSLLDAGLTASAVDNIRDREWSKMATWVGLVALSTATRQETWRFLSNSHSALLLVRTAREIQRLAAAEGCRLFDDAGFPVAQICGLPDGQAVRAILEIGRSFQHAAPSHRVSALQDIEAGRRLELDETIGYILQLARSKALAVPVLEVIYELVSAIDSSRPLDEIGPEGTR